MFRELTKKSKQLPHEECIRLLENEKRGVLSVLGDGGYPYGMPMNHWYNAEDGKIYFHCGRGGHRLDSLAENNKVSFCVLDGGVKKENDWAYAVKSVVVFGEIEVIDDIDRVTDIAAKLSRKFTQDEEYIRKEIAAFGPETLLLVLTPEHICGKRVLEK